MFSSLRLKNFKSFRDATLSPGPFTLLVGTNASGKSNVRDAFRFLHGIGRGYSLADIIGGKYGEGGDRLWTGMRGGTRELTYQNTEHFGLEASFPVDPEQNNGIVGIDYHIEVDPGSTGKAPRIVREGILIITSGYAETYLRVIDELPHMLMVRFDSSSPAKEEEEQYFEFSHSQPIIWQCLDRKDIDDRIQAAADIVLKTLRSMRFLDLQPDAMRLPSFPGQNMLGDRGENISSVLQAISIDPQRNQALLRWVQALTPMDAVAFEFPTDQIGRILMTLVEEGGQYTTAYSASDGTLRFLGILAALLGPEPAQFYFFEELENGIHPTRLHLLLELIEQQITHGRIQIIATTHSPQLLRLASPATLEHAALTYRLEDHQDTRIRRILNIPEARQVLEKQDLARLHESGWLEDAVAFMADDEEIPF